MYRAKNNTGLAISLAVSLALHAGILSLRQEHLGLAWLPAIPAQDKPLTVHLTAGVTQPSPGIPVMMQSAGKISDVHQYGLLAPVYRTRELSRLPEMIGKPPDLIEIGQGVSGEVLFQVSVGKLGRASMVQKLESTLPREIEGKLAMLLYKAEYRAGEINGAAVNSQMTVGLKLEPGGWITDSLPILRPAR